MKTIFWNVDTQYDFMRDDETFKGALSIPGARKIEGNLEEITKLARRMGKQIVNTACWHNENTKEFSSNPDYKESFPPHCLIGTKGAEFVPATKPLNAYIVDWQKPYDEKKLAWNVLENKEIIIYKDAFDVFEGSMYAQEILGVLNPDRVIVYGVATNVCVDAAVKGILNHTLNRYKKIEVLVVEDAIKELSGAPLEEVLESWKGMGAKLIKTNDLYRTLFWLS